MQTVSYLDVFLSLSTALDLVNARLGNHHKLTCYIASKMHAEFSDDQKEYEALFSAALVHDIGASSLSERMDILEFEGKFTHDHALMGESLLEAVEPLSHLGSIVGDHHILWDNGKGQEHNGRHVSDSSHLIQLADRVAVLIDQDLPIIGQAENIRDRVLQGEGKLFSKQLVELFCDISTRHDFWLSMDSSFLDKSISDLSTFDDRHLDLQELESLSRIYAFIIDSRSRFTASHSSGVANVAEAIALAHGLSREDSIKIKIAGYLHDIGKLSVPGEILEKNGKLDDGERLIMNGHSFYTQKIIAGIKGMEDIGLWAAQHHEFIDGSGYPFGLSGAEISPQSRILTIADIFTALTEDRPYRDGLGVDETLGMLQNFAQRGQIDADILATLQENANDINGIRSSSQIIENSKLNAFRKDVDDRIAKNSETVH